ncbi:MAG: NADH-quinone oxidoreductase subunit J [Chloroflexota bacterium]|nr:MAG: NADH-quinone oxidoreductase subunit J [Chloroflexota bacterium]
MNDNGVALSIVFYVLTIITVGAAIGVVTVRNIFHAALLLVLTFVGVAGLYITLQADFIAAVQILVYAGAVAILLVFAIMLTHNLDQSVSSSILRWPALLMSALVGAMIVGYALSTNWPVSAQQPVFNTTVELANALFTKFVMPFEVASILLLAAMVGAIVLARGD